MTIDPNFRVTDDGVPARLDLLVVALGYEERSAHVAGQLASRAQRKVALAFEGPETLSFGNNSEKLSVLGFSVESVQANVGAQVASLIAALPADASAVGIDISSFTRLQLAQMLDELLFSTLRRLDVTFLYAPAASDGWERESGPMVVAKPIHPAFTSWIDDPALPLAAIIGVGVEDNLALGVAEYLDVSSVYAFVPVGGDPGFDSLNAKANRDFLGTNYVVRRSEYDVLDPFRLFSRIESLIYGIGPETRVAVVPLGPKLFTLCGILAAVASGRAATVWRFSFSDATTPVDRFAAGPVTSLHLELSSKLGS